ncbi:bifunctional phosphopantothenoylcysteine decarboxylase/phosphopantothenate--cysteine ligase CoaBC [Roseococcus sp. SDR]|uniref:bifunctional phosphopantothenoylcysteine decarboxylase/phosphopantothenate--cysteine ligase CoaBC n=1 Tax=Roseococcus sp. SDR TaxID=2835532 RepID=UPI001BCB86D5|nr:bifunctional phosphopantothenoylcysteine decarboxylase/phosphopantothenate--cysteine ligase CoaBC [Roseococcus sp. SDR]MBS7790068.1 bifunctional phosphopantothenoylcysteine decarboxylase/phosphopantothenate--cysteine ligase CoaBC [Roseococcus sp. SDR]MBV1845382.1 bifunctional phosphopantothenoylcysteine decarboxylase/phosphopantothenate--cysteine ligase CoaBC [Roseococcus sp. SDR]
MLQGRKILLIVSGSVAAFKALMLVRLLRAEGATVRAVLTAGGARFVTKESLAAITGEAVQDDLWAAEAEIGHIRLARWADAVVVAPASANRLAQMAHGLAEDLAGCILLATRAPVLVAPAMNPAMWAHPATRANIATLAARDVHFIGPEDGPMAEPESGPGRLSEPEAIAYAIRTLLASGPLSGRHALVTSGPTHEPIDPVRYIANRSSGKQGHAIAAALAALGARVTLVSGPVALPDPPGVTVRRVETAREMLAACEAALPADIAIFAAAVADWRVAREAGQKLKKQPGAEAPTLDMALNPDILATISRHASRPALVVGFAAETEKVVEHARDKLARKGCDWIVANDVSGDVMGGAENAVHLVTGSGVEDWPRMPKEEVAARLAARIAEHVA